MGGVAGSALKMLQGPVMDVIGRVTQQINVLGDAQSQLSGFASGIPGVWIGEDAEAFAEEVQSRVIPEIMALIAAIGGLPGGLNNAVNVVTQTDSQAKGAVGALGDLFGSIF